MTPGERFKAWIEGLSESWKVRLKGWMVSWLSLGIEALLDVLGKRMAPVLKPTIDKIEANTTIPPELKPIFDEIKEPKGEIAAFFARQAGGSIVSGAIGSIIDWVLRPLLAGLSYNPTFHLAKPELLISEYYRHLISKDTLYELMRYHGIDPAHVDQILVTTQARFPSEIVAPLWLRNKPLWERFWDDVKQIGVDDDHILALKELAYRVPNAQDVIRYAVKEAYKPDIYKTFGQDQEFPTEALADAEAAGVRSGHLLKEWIAHWNLPSTGQGFDLLHRGKISDTELDKLLKALDIMPFWRGKLLELSWDLPNRVELRMLARYGLVDKAFLVQVLKEVGLREDYREITADLMLAQGMMTDLKARYANKWINSQELKAEIAAAGLTPTVQDRLYSWIVKNAAPERTAKELDLTKTEIIKGVKTGIITWADGIGRLVSLGYDDAEATYILAINIEVVEEEPTTALGVKTDTIRRQRRQRLINKDQEIASLLSIGLDSGLAAAYADNDDLRLVKVTTEEA